MNYQQHWSVETSLHWCRDVVFANDQMRARAEHDAHNFSVVRNFALNLIRYAPVKRKGGLKANAFMPHIQSSTVKNYLVFNKIHAIALIDALLLFASAVGMVECTPSPSLRNDPMFARFMPQEGKFFELFNEHAEQVVLGSKALLELLTVLNDSDEDAAKQCEKIDSIENRADGITHETMRQLHKSFITPLDRDEIHQLITGLDDILDLLQDVAHTVTLYNVRHITVEAISLAEICSNCCERVRSAVALLPSMDNGPEILKICHEIDQLESAGDRGMRSAMSRLFREEPDVRELIKFKAIYELLETVTDRCEDVANIIEGIVLENS